MTWWGLIQIPDFGKNSSSGIKFVAGLGKNYAFQVRKLINGINDLSHNADNLNVMTSQTENFGSVGIYLQPNSACSLLQIQSHSVHDSARR